MVFVPFDRAAAEGLQNDGEPATERVGCAATAGLRQAHGLDTGVDASLDEEANFQAQTYAIILGLTERRWPDGRRIVLAADVPDPLVAGAPVVPAQFGQVVVAELRWAWVSAVFSDGGAPPATLPGAVRVATDAVAGSSLADAAERPEVDQLIEEHDLLWHVPDEPW